MTRSTLREFLGLAPVLENENRCAQREGEGESEINWNWIGLITS